MAANYTYLFRYLCIGLVSCYCFAAQAWQPSPGVHHYSSGTGFFVSRNGHILTNAHVVAPCREKDVVFLGPNRQPQVAKLVSRRDDLDLALFRSEGYHPDRIASFRWSGSEPEPKEKLFILGYPEPQNLFSAPVAVDSVVVANRGPSGESEFMQFENAARHGNSGGPLMDYAGNVVGVVTGKTSLFRRNAYGKKELVSESDIAINLNTVRRFLDANYVMYQQNESYGELTARRLEQIAQTYTVHVFCETTN